MNHIRFLKNTIQPYAWGSRTAIAELLGQKSPADHPEAELWMGAHPAAPSLVFHGKRWIPLPEIIRQSPVDLLGARAVNLFGPELPFLFKVLAAAEPLSIQAHPDAIQAKLGFEEENRLGIPPDAAHRNFKDPNHKPECICALTPFWALKGFRKISEICRLLAPVAPEMLKIELRALARCQDVHGLKSFYTMLMTLEKGVRRHLVDKTVAAALILAEQGEEYRWVKKLHELYPGDVGVLSPLLLNLVCLRPGQAMFLPAGELHAYLDGVGIELMANSDNVLRGGLTPKHVDMEALLSVLSFQERSIEILSAKKDLMGEQVYAGKAKEFVLSVIRVDPGCPFNAGADRCVEILLCTQGAATFIESDSGNQVPTRKGNSVIIPASVMSYEIRGEATFYKAAVP